MTKYLVALCAVLGFAVHTLSAADAARELTIKVQSGERWWGLVVDAAQRPQPFSTAFSFDGSRLSPTDYSANIMLSNRGRYLYSAHPLRVSFDGKEFKVTPVDAKAPVPELEKSGRTLRESYLMCCHKYFPPSNLSACTALFDAPIYELGGEDALLYTQQDVEQFARMLAERGAPKGTILLPQGWNSPNTPTSFDMEAYPSPKELVASLHKQGMKVMLTITPYVMAAGRAYQQSRKDGVLLKGSDSEPIVFESRLGHTACIDLRLTGAEKLNKALGELQSEYDIDGFYFDCLDAMPLLSHDSEQLASFLEVWNSASEGLDIAIYTSPRSEPLCASASSISTSREQSWKSLELSLQTAIEASVLGFSRTCVAADLNYASLANVPAKSDEELILRSAQLALTLPVAIVPYAVWGLEAHEAVDESLRWRGEVSSYVAEVAAEAAGTAEPIVRHLEYQFPRKGFANCHDQFMLGDKYLVAPVTEPAERRMVRLPKGRWEAPDGRIIKGPKVIDLDVSDGKMAIFELKE